MNLGFEEVFEVKELNPIVMNSLNLQTIIHDFFSKKSTNYEKAVEVTYLRDEDFDLSFDINFENLS